LAVLGKGGFDDRVNVSGDPEHCLKSVGKFYRPVKICSEVDLLAVPLTLETSFNLRQRVEKENRVRIKIKMTPGLKDERMPVSLSSAIIPSRRYCVYVVWD
jgi:hypothetical protein